MTKTKKEMIVKALRKYRGISKPYNCRTFNDCFTREGNVLYFWFNTDDNTTRVVLSSDQDENTSL